MTPLAPPWARNPSKISDKLPLWSHKKWPWSATGGLRYLDFLYVRIILPKLCIPLSLESSFSLSYLSPFFSAIFVINGNTSSAYILTRRMYLELLLSNSLPLSPTVCLCSLARMYILAAIFYKIFSSICSSVNSLWESFLLSPPKSDLLRQLLILYF